LNLCPSLNVTRSTFRGNYYCRLCPQTFISVLSPTAMDVTTDAVNHVVRQGEQVSHIGLIGSGGYGEIHSVQPLVTTLTRSQLRDLNSSEVLKLTDFTLICAVFCQKTYQSVCGKHQRGRYCERGSCHRQTLQKFPSKHRQRIETWTLQPKFRYILHRYGTMRSQSRRILTGNEAGH
jgi:hypothetical protein